MEYLIHDNIKNIKKCMHVVPLTFLPLIIVQAYGTISLMPIRAEACARSEYD